MRGRKANACVVTCDDAAPRLDEPATTAASPLGSARNEGEGTDAGMDGAERLERERKLLRMSEDYRAGKLETYGIDEVGEMLGLGDQVGGMP